MKALCISASNMKHAGDKGTSLIACQIIEKIIKTRLKRKNNTGRYYQPQRR